MNRALFPCVRAARARWQHPRRASTRTGPALEALGALAAIAGFAALAFLAPAARACGPFFETVVLTYATHPEPPLADYAAGRLGVLQPTWRRTYLIVAYRYLTADALSKDGQAAAVALWEKWLGLVRTAPTHADSVWLAARARVPGVVPGRALERYGRLEGASFYGGFLSCGDDALLGAARTLEARVAAFGARHPAVADWVRAQDVVFADCAGDSALPGAAPADAPAIFRADRDYQTAAALFYARRFDEAERAFRTLGLDRASPWRTIAPYLVARTLIRRATLVAGEGSFDPATLTRAEAKLDSILADPGEKAWHPAARGLLELVRSRLHPRERVGELSRAVLDPSAGAGLEQDLFDYSFLLARAAERTDELSDWLLTVQGTGGGEHAHALERWRETGSTIWAVAAILGARGAELDAPALLALADRARPQDSAARLTLAYHAIRLAMERGDAAGARARLERALGPGGPALTRSDRNLFLAERALVGQTLADFLRDAIKTPAGTTWDESGDELPATAEGEPPSGDYARACFDRTSAETLNRDLPLVRLREAVLDPALPAHLSRDLALSTWTRAVLLDDRVTARAVAPVLARLAPELVRRLDAWRHASGSGESRFAAVDLLLHAPGAQALVSAGIGRTQTAPIASTDPFRNNWWCTLPPERGEWNGWAGSGYTHEVDWPAGALRDSLRPAFLTAEDRRAAEAERARLVALDVAPNWLCRETLAWAVAHRDDPRVPEALHLAVRSTRYGCADRETGGWSKQAFQLLHRRYPKSEWAKKTRYWFGQN